MKSSLRRRGFALIELLLGLAIVAAILALFSLSAADARRNASLGGSLSNLKQFAWAGSAYAGDCNDRFWTFSWTPTSAPEGFPPYPDYLTAAADQARYIINSRTKLQISRPTNWLPNLQYSQLVLAVQLNLPLPLPWAASPADTQRLLWQQCEAEDDPQQCFLSLPPTQRPSDGSGSELPRWIVSSSYQVGPSFVSRNQREGSQLTLQSTISNHYSYDAQDLPLGDRTVTQVAFPSRKVQVFEYYQRFFGNRAVFFAYPEARVPLLMADGSVTVRTTSESNLGFYPNIPTNALPLRYNYAPRTWEPATLSGASSELVTGHYQWTRGGLAGNDYSAPEACTGQPGCTP